MTLPVIFTDEIATWEACEALAVVNSHLRRNGYDAAYVRAHMQRIADAAGETAYVETLGYVLTISQGDHEVWNEETGALAYTERRRFAKASLSPSTVARFLRAIATA